MNDPGWARLQFVRRLGGSWRDLAFYLDIPPYDSDKWPHGNEPELLWRWLQDRDALSRLPAALNEINREDLVELFRQSPVCSLLGRAVSRSGLSVRFRRP